MQLGWAFCRAFRGSKVNVGRFSRPTERDMTSRIYLERGMALVWKELERERCHSTNEDMVNDTWALECLILYLPCRR